MRISIQIAILAALLAACHSPPSRPEISVAAAANLSGAFTEISRQFEQESGIHVVLSFGATGQLTQQIEHGAPFDVFAAADTAHIDQLETEGLLEPGSRAIYARGRLALWSPPGSKAAVARIEDLRRPAVKFIAIANPKLAPYGQAAIETLTNLGLWDELRPKVVYAETILMAKQYAMSHNADVCFTAWSLVFREAGHAIPIDERLHRPIGQALGMVKNSGRKNAAGRFIAFLLRGGGKQILTRFGYEV